jgi:hypothetical protein
MGLRTEIIFWILVRSFQNGFDILIAHERDLAFALLLSCKCQRLLTLVVLHPKGNRLLLLPQFWICAMRGSAILLTKLFALALLARFGVRAAGRRSHDAL